MTPRQIAVGCILAGVARAAELPSAEYDVAVIGGGSAGICAALASGRAGAKTVLAEAAHQVGGNTTTGGVNFPGLFHAWGRQVIDGIGWSLVTNTLALDGGRLPDFNTPTGKHHYRHQIPVNIPLFVALSEEALAQAGVTIHYHAAPVRIEKTDSGWRVFLAAVGDTWTITCRQIVDCTGNGAVAAMLKMKRLQEEERQPGTFVYRIKTDTDLTKLDAKMVQARFNEAVKQGMVLRGDCRWSVPHYLQAGGNTANYVEGADNSTAEARTRTNLRGRAAMLRMVRFLKSIPGLERVRVESMSPEVGIRETYRVLGEHRITGEEYIRGQQWDDSVCYAFYPVDLHDAKTGVKPAHLAEGVVPTVPLRALIPLGSRDLLVAGRCLSSDRQANSALRVQAACMATGQAAGAAAALAARHGITPGAVPLGALKELLRSQGAVVPGTTAKP